MKYRIEVNESYSGKKIYYPQYKKYFKWNYWYVDDAYDWGINHIIKFSDEKSAREFIEKKIGYNIKNTTYINYGEV
jgi:hypothetical protein